MRSATPAVASRAEFGPWHFPAEALPCFDEVASFRYPFERSYPAAGFLAQVRRRLDAAGSPVLTASFMGMLAVAGRRSPG